MELFNFGSFNLLFVFVIGATFGSFLSAYTYRAPRGLSVKDGRSFCDECKKQIAWFDNIPLLSYVLLGGKCRNCANKISIRYPLVELITALSFAATYFFLSLCKPGQDSVFCSWADRLGVLALPYFLVVAAFLVIIFVIDLERQLIYDFLVFTLLGVTSILLILFFPDRLYEYLFAGFASSLFLLIVHILTRGRGMGLGDVKFALFAGVLLGLKLMAAWLFTSFLLGALVGVFLILSKRSSFGKHIPFGPFLVVSLFAALFFEKSITMLLFPVFL